MSLTFLVGDAADVFGEQIAGAVDAELRSRFTPPEHGESYESEPVDATGWRQLQTRVLRTLSSAPHIAGVDAYQAVYIPVKFGDVDHVAVGNLADPLQIASLPELLSELGSFAAAASLPTDDVELMQLGAHYLEDEDIHRDLDVQTYVQLMLSAKQATARGQALWIVV
jgi:hypothetical protein